ncbi:MAG: 50S ribosomal protein L1 [Candidatus Omnitrophota bacterium]
MSRVAEKTGSKRYQKRAALVDPQKAYTIDEAIKALKKAEGAKCDETVTVDFQLGIRPEQTEEMVRGTVVLPNGTGKKIRVVCICKGEAAREAQEAGADEVGAEEILQKIQGGWLDFDALVAHPDMMRELSKLGRILGPRGLMPSPKAGTVSPNVGKAVKDLKGGKIEFKSDKTGGVHAICGKFSFTEEALTENAKTLIRAVRDAKPASSKGIYLKRITIALSQGPGARIQTASI